MSGMTVESIKEAISGLPEENRVSLATWLNLQTMDEWDKQMQRDFSPGGRHHHLVDRVKADIRAGRIPADGRGPAA